MAAPQPQDDATLGFTRKEMYSEALAGTAKATIARHLCMAWGKAEEWPPQVPDDFPAESLPKKVEAIVAEAGKATGEKLRVTYIEASKSVKEGDVLVFPDYVKVSAQSAAGLGALKNYLSKKRVPGQQRCIEDVEDLDTGFLLVCAHTSRDARCGFCGPKLVEAFEQKGVADSANLQVLKCSHVGGHVYAGNVISYSGKGTPENEDGHWYGYVKPEDAACVAAGKAVRSNLWRGRLGLSEAGAKKERKMQRLKESALILGFVAVAGVAVTALLMRKKKTSSQ
mmetsp:Transcript_23245/g.50996  ORF Transcript_23245/g.50996 Transcript_23245/m.50996 type:complete len:282 (-) Transcript_23245:419-1264(-)